MKVILLFVAVVNAISLAKSNSTRKAVWEKAVYPNHVENKNHRCHNPKDCKVKCANGTYVRTRDEETEIDELRCVGPNSDYTFITSICRLDHGGGMVPARHKMACEHVNGLYCLPKDEKTVKKSMLYRCILDPADFDEWKTTCEGGIRHMAAAPDKKEVPWDCNPDFLE